MNEQLLMDAIGYLDGALVEEHFRRKARLTVRRGRRRADWLVNAIAVAAACLVLAVFAMPFLMKAGAPSSEDDIFERSNTVFDSYEDLAAVIGTGTLLENIDFSALPAFELRLIHELDDVRAYHAVSFVANMPEDQFGVGVYFPPYQGIPEGLTEGGDTVTINGIAVTYQDRTAGSICRYCFVAEFTYGGCRYQVHAMGNSDERVFWDALDRLLGL